MVRLRRYIRRVYFFIMMDYFNIALTLRERIYQDDDAIVIIAFKEELGNSRSII
jgi:hypothetical protein